MACWLSPRRLLSIPGCQPGLDCATLSKICCIFWYRERALEVPLRLHFLSVVLHQEATEELLRGIIHGSDLRVDGAASINATAARRTGGLNFMGGGL